MFWIILACAGIVAVLLAVAIRHRNRIMTAGLALYFCGLLGVIIVMARILIAISR